MVKIKDVVRSCYLCLRFPFLYPRNVYGNKHYSNYKLDEKRKEIYRKWSEWVKDHQELYFDVFGEDCLIDFEPVDNIFTPEDFTNSIVKCEYVMKHYHIPLKDRFLYWLYGFLNDFLAIFHFIPTWSEFDAIPYGWRKRFGIQFCKELKEAILKSGGKKLMKEFRIHQIKEKWGKFTFYVNTYPKEVDRVIKKYEYISQFVCIDCGEDAVKKTVGWICPYCEHCLPKNKDWIWIDPVYGWSNAKRSEENKNKMEEWRK